MLESTIRECYYDYLIENDLEDNEETINLFLSFMYYEIQDNLEELFGDFNIPKELEGIEAQNYVEDIIRQIVKEV